MSPGEAFEYINKLARARVPFLCIIDYHCAKPLVLPLDSIDPGDIRYSINGHTNYTNPAKATLRQWLTEPVEFSIYRNAFQKIQYHLGRGDSFLLNLTFETPLKTNLSLEELFNVSQARYKLYFKDLFVTFSPEPFVRIADGTISAFPMKGTIPASMPQARKEIMNDPKELEEHYTIVDLIRNDLSKVSSGVKVERFRYIERLRTAQRDLFQVSSKITGKLPAGYFNELGYILKALLPAGSISGAPKKRTLEIIDEVETYSRGYFTGLVGLFDGYSFDSGVMIRFLEKTPRGMIFKSGGGITVNSDVRKEYQEMLDKVYVPIA